MDVRDQKPVEDPKIQEELTRILSKDQNDLTVTDRAFLRARKSYLGRNARSKFAEALAEETPVEEAVETPEEEAKEVDNSQHPADNSQASQEDDVE